MHAAAPSERSRSGSIKEIRQWIYAGDYEQTSPEYLENFIHPSHLFENSWHKAVSIQQQKNERG